MRMCPLRPTATTTLRQRASFSSSSRLEMDAGPRERTLLREGVVEDRIVDTNKRSGLECDGAT